MKRPDTSGLLHRGDLKKAAKTTGVDPSLLTGFASKGKFAWHIGNGEFVNTNRNSPRSGQRFTIGPAGEHVYADGVTIGIRPEAERVKPAQVPTSVDGVGDNPNFVAAGARTTKARDTPAQIRQARRQKQRKRTRREWTSIG